MLRTAGYWTISASGPVHALKESRDFRGEIHLLLTDIIMPEMDGFDLAQEIAAERGTIRVLLMSGYMDGPCWLPHLRKPFRIAELLEKVRRAIDGSPPPAIQ